MIVVLPFDNLSGDPEQQYFSDGITGDIADRLLRFRSFAVIGQYSASAFRGPAQDFAVIRDALKADFAVTGTIRRAGDRVRVALRLSSVETGEAIWAERYDRPITDMFALQDEISELVAAAIASHLAVEINERSSGKPQVNLTSYEHMLQGYWQYRKFTWASNFVARECFEQAAALDGRNAEAFAWLACTYASAWTYDFSVENAAKAAELSAAAVALDPLRTVNHSIQTYALLCNGDLEAALRASDRGLALNPGQPGVLVNRGLTLAYDGRTAEARQLMVQALKPRTIAAAVVCRVQQCHCVCRGTIRRSPHWRRAARRDRMGHHVCLVLLRASGAAGAGARNTRAAAAARAAIPIGASESPHEPYRDESVRERLIAGLKLALTWGEAS